MKNTRQHDNWMHYMTLSRLFFHNSFIGAIYSWVNIVKRKRKKQILIEGKVELTWHSVETSGNHLWDCGEGGVPTVTGVEQGMLLYPNPDQSLAPGSGHDLFRGLFISWGHSTLYTLNTWLNYALNFWHV